MSKVSLFILRVVLIHGFIIFQWSCKPQVVSRRTKPIPSGDATNNTKDGVNKTPPSPNPDVGTNTAPVASCAGQVLGIVDGKRVAESSLISRSTGQLWLEDSDCTATLIGPRHMLTAAHCLADANPIEVRFGLKPDSAKTVIPVAKWVIHPLYNDREIPHDIAIFTLENEVPSELVPVPLANPEDLQIGTDIIITGYGTASEKSENSQPLSMVLVPLEEVNAADRYFSTVINGKASCYGDSGGPGYIVDKQTQCLKAVGVVSIASINGNGKCGEGDTMMDATRYKGWIAASFEQLGAPLSGLPKDGSELDATQNRVKSVKN
ncbi:MAG: trypsin-like serine protease [Oligoflexales bacterium]